MSPRNRRDFLKSAAAGGLTAFALTGTKASGRVLGANDDIRLGVIGLGSTVKIGGQGTRDMETFRKMPGVRVVALCDVDSASLGREAEKFQRRNEKVAAYSDMRQLLDRKDIDVVSVVTPNHWHALATIWACQAGKDVWVQKPASHNIFEGRKMVEAARKYNRIVQCSNGSRTPHGFQEALDYVHQGNLGKLVLSHGFTYRSRTSIGKTRSPQPVPSTVNFDLWSGPAPTAALMRQNLHYDWHWDWGFGNGDMGNTGIHYVDGCRMAVGDKLPRHVISIGGRFGYDDDGQTPNTQIIFYDYEPAPILFEVRGLPKDKSLMKETGPGSDSWGKGAMDTYLGVEVGKVLHCENGYVLENKAFDNNGKQIKEFRPATPELFDNFIQAVRSRRAGDLVADILQGHLSAALVHMANISYRVGKPMPSIEIGQRIQGNKDLADCFDRFKTHLSANGIELEKTPPIMGAMLTMDPDAERFVGEFSDVANKLVSREYRQPFVVPEEV